MSISLIPPVVGLLWGPFFSDHVYGTFRFAQNLAAGRGLTFDAAVSTPYPLLESPLLVLLLTNFSRVLPSPQLGFMLSVLGWSATAIAILFTGWASKHRLAAGATAVLIVFNPAFIDVLGSANSWAVSLAWIAIAFLLNPSTNEPKHTTIGVGLLLLLLGTHFDLSTVLLIGLLLGVQWSKRQRFPRWQAIILLIAILGWGGFAIWQHGVLFNIRPLQWGIDPVRLFHESEFYWLFLPLLAIGLFQLGSFPQSMLVGLAWTVSAGLTGSTLAETAITVMALFLVGLGVEWVVHQFSKLEFQVDRSKLTVTILALLSLGLLIPQWSSLKHRYSSRPVARYELDQQVAKWLRENSDPNATLFAPQRIGYLADRRTLAAEIQQLSQQDWAQLFAKLMETEPDYLVSSRSVDWSYLLGSGQFLDRYDRQEEFASEYDANSPVIIWEHTSTLFDIGEPQAAHAVVPDKLTLVAYKYAPKEINPGDDIHITLYLQATQPVTRGFNTSIHLVYAQDSWVWGWLNEPTPRTVNGPWWQAGQIIEERFTLVTEEKLPQGAYELQISWHWANETTAWPIYQDNDTNALDRVRLGYVAAPPLVDSSQSTPVNAEFGDQILLSGAEMRGEVVPGELIEVILYWDALRPPADNYAVFLHLLDPTGQYLTGHDGEPMEARYPTQAWLPGTTIKDSHPIVLPAEMPSGPYQLNVGLYSTKTGERLPVRDSRGVEQIDHTLSLMSFDISN